MIFSNWFSPSKTGHQLNSKTIYEDLYPEIVKRLDQNETVSQIIEWLKQEATNAYSLRTGKTPTIGSLNNSAGRWNQFIAVSLLCEIAIDIYKSQGKCVAVFSIENSSIAANHNNRISSSFLRLFDPTEFSYGNSLNYIEKFKYKIFFPSPDYIIAVIENTNLIPDVFSLLKKQSQDPGNLGLYLLLKEKLKAKEIKAVVSLKTSNRPDRRYQPSYEAAMIKAIGYRTKHNWKYYMVASELSKADKRLFDTAISPHGIALGINSNLVDGVYLYERKSDLFNLMNDALQ